MPFIYPTTSEITASLNSGSYLSQLDYNLFVNSNDQSDFWYSTSVKDVIQLSVYDLNKNLIHWKVINNVAEYKEHNNLSYCDSKGNVIPYSYKETVFNRPLYKTNKILVNPTNDLSKSNVSTGSYILSYQFVRNMVGSSENTLTIKEISPSKTELKLIPSSDFSIEYRAFCLGKIQLNNVSPLYTNSTKEFPVVSLYEKSSSDPENLSAINLIKNLFFIPNDNSFVEFLDGLYEDYIKYSNPHDDGNKSYVKIQGIKTHFNNFLISNSDNIFTFDDIKKQFELIVSERLATLFSNYQGVGYLSAKNYLFDLFVSDYFLPIHNTLEFKYNEKYNSPLKNALCFGSGKYLPILNTSYLDERNSDSDPLTLLVKLQSPISDELSVKSSVWISNMGMVPFLFNCVIKEEVLHKTIKISPADFTVGPKNISLSFDGNYFSNDDLENEIDIEDDITVSKKINELNVDYTKLENFVVFSSAELRHNIFKNKMLTLSNINSSLTTLDVSYSSSMYSYPYYTEEKNTFIQQKTSLIESFDGFESSLYKTGYYEYDSNTNTFNSSSFVDYMNEETAKYDKYNKDSLINNTPEHIVVDVRNDDYLVFLSMIGHYFDNLYLYIKSMPHQRFVEDNNTLSNNMLQQMLQSFGWKLDASLESLNIADNFLDSSLSGDSKFSANERTRQIWNRILNTLPLIYKTKGTEECVKLVLACYGIPSTLINIREYGGINYSDTNKTSYTIDEKIFMLTFKGYREYLSIPFDPSLKTIEFKTSLNVSKDWQTFEKIPLVVKYNQFNTVDWTLGVYKEPQRYLGRAYFELEYPTYNIGIVGDYGSVNPPTTQSFQVADSLIAANPDIVLALGDNTYETGPNAYDNTVGRLYHSFINPYVGVSGSGATVNRFFPVIGNRDYIGGSYNQYHTFFPTTPRFYTHKKGNVQFFMLNSDSNEPSGSTSTSAQSTWLKQEISSSYGDIDILWRVAVFHHDFISSGHPANLGSWMDWPFESWGIDLIITGHDHFYERLEQDGIPIIIQGAGGAPLYNFTTTIPESKFKFNNIHSYSILTSRGNTLSLTTYDMFGNKIFDTGSTSLPSSSVENGVFIMSKPTIPFSDRPFRQGDKYILSEPVPIFNGEIFNLMIRKNNPDVLFEYNLTTDLVPTKYDLRVQRKDDSRTIFSSYESGILTQTYNYKFSNRGSLYFGNYQNSSSFLGLLDKILIWDTPITDDTFDDHCNNLNSYSYTGSSVSHETLYFRMGFDYPQDLSLSTPQTIVNSNEYYSSSIYALANNFGIIANSSSIDSCVNTSHSVYPYQFTEIPYNQTFTISSYGPNKFKNQKIQSTDFDVVARLDPDNRSTVSKNQFVSPDSNQVGLFADPNDYKNKDIFRYLGDFNVMSLIADPGQMFDDRYKPLENVNDLYNRSGNKKVLYNEMFTLYKFYFDKSIFETINQLIPARNNVLTGILIEPTVLERPKYQYKRLGSQACELQYTSSLGNNTGSSDRNRPDTLSFNNNIYSAGSIGSEFISADFGSPEDLQSNRNATVDLSKPKLTTSNYPITYKDGIIYDIENPEELGIYCDSSGKVVELVFSGSRSRYLIKNWKRDNIYVTVGEHSNPQTVESQSIYLYTTQVWNDGEYQKLIYTSSFNEIVPISVVLTNAPSINDYAPSYTVSPSGFSFQHDIRTFKQRPNSTTDNVYGQFYPFNPNLSTIRLINVGQYFETMVGYSRNHLTHKRLYFSNESKPIYSYVGGVDRHVKSRQTLDTTVDFDGLSDNSLPVQTTTVSNVNMIKSNNVLEK